MPNVKGIIFDLDMTLVDTSSLAALREKRKWQEVSLQISSTKIYPGVRESISRLRQCYKLGVVTSSPRGYAESVLKFHGIDIPVLVAYHDTKKHKPSPAPLVAACEMLDLKPGEVVSIGDQASDYQAALAGGFQNLHAGWSTPAYDEIPPNAICKSPLELQVNIAQLEYSGGFLYSHLSIEGLETSYHLANYLPRNRGGDKLSNLLLAFKDGVKQVVDSWLSLAQKAFNHTPQQYDVIIRALGSEEVMCSGETALDQLGVEVAALCGAQYQPERLTKKYTNDPLKYLSRVQRHQALRDIYTFNHEGIIDGSNILVIDDVITTGSTIRELCRTIKSVRPGLNIHLFTLTKTFNAYTDFYVNPEILENFSGGGKQHKEIKRLQEDNFVQDTIKECGGFFLEALFDVIPEEQCAPVRGLLSSLSTFQIQCTNNIDPQPLDSERSAIFNVLYNMVQRGLPTRPSFNVESKLASALGGLELVERYGGSYYRAAQLEKGVQDRLVRAFHVIDPRIDRSKIQQMYKYSWEILDSTYEEKFYFDGLTRQGSQDWVLQCIEPQRPITSIIKQPTRNKRLIQKFTEQRCDFAIDFPYSSDGTKGLVIEVDGPHHTQPSQEQLDRSRDKQLKNSDWKTIRIPTSEWSKLENYLDEIELLLTGEYFASLQLNYNTPLYKSKYGRKALQLALSPILIGRVQKTLLWAILDQHLDLNADLWNICIIERDVPGSLLAIEDMLEQLDHLNELQENPIIIPKTQVQVYTTQEFKTAEIHKLHDSQPKLCSEISKDKKHYDLVIDVSTLSRVTFWGPERFSKPPDSYLLVRSSLRTEGNRKFRTGQALRFKEMMLSTETNGKIEKIEDSDLRIHLEYFLKNVFRKSNLRPGQLPILDRALRQKSVIGLLPTGGGKSLTYQLSTLLQPGITLIVDPIKSLMRDQVNSLNTHHIDCCDFVNSSISREEKDLAHSRVMTGDVLFFFISPERLQLKDFRAVLAASQSFENYFSYAVIDEAHCVSEWGHDFRTSYLFLGKNMKRFAKTISGQGITILGLTATASYDVLADIQREMADDIENLDSILGDDAIVRFETFNRPEMQYAIIPVKINKSTRYSNTWSAKEDLGLRKHAEIINLLETIPGKLEQLNNDPESVYIPITDDIDKPDPNELFNKIHITSFRPNDFWNNYHSNAGIIFCPHRSWYFGVTDKFKTDKVKSVGIYDSILAKKPEFENITGTFFGSSDSDVGKIETINIQNQTKFTNNELSLMVATKAFGMGIDKPNVRFSIHLNYPESLESFVQEAGRIGRDGKTALACVVFNDQYVNVEVGNRPSKSFNIDREILNDFYNSSFPGVRKERQTLIDLLRNIQVPPNSNLSKICEHYAQKTGKEVHLSYRLSSAGNPYLTVRESHNLPLGIIFLEPISVKPNSPNDGIINAFEELSAIANEINLFVPKGEDAKTWLANEVEGVEGIEGLLANMAYGESRTISINFNNERSNLDAELREIVNAANIPKDQKTINDFSKTKDIEAFLDNLELPDNSIKKRLRNNFYARRDKQDTEKALYRLALIGVVSDYTVDFNRKTFNVTITKRTQEQYEKYLRAYIRRYYSKNKTEQIVTGIKELKGEKYIHKALNFIIAFLYDEIAKKRWKAIDAIEEACRVGSQQGNGAMKEYIDVYFNSKYGRYGYTYEHGNVSKNGSLAERTDDGKVGDLNCVWEFISIATELDKSGAELVNLKHLRGACVRFLNPNPSNYALLLLKAFCTLILEEVRVRDSVLIPEAINEISHATEIMIADEKINMTSITDTIDKYFSLLINNSSSQPLREKLDEIKQYLVVHANRMWVESFNGRFLEKYE